MHAHSVLRPSPVISDINASMRLSCTLQAYLEPTGASGLQEKAANGTETTFTDRSAC